MAPPPALAVEEAPIDGRARGVKCDGVADDTAAIQAALDTGLAVLLPPGVCRTSATLNFTTVAQNGQRLLGAGESAQAGNGAGATILRPGAAVSLAVRIDGAPFGSYIQGVSLSDLTIDMAEMPAGAVAVDQHQAFDISADKVRVIHSCCGAGKLSWAFRAGAYTTTLRDFQGGVVYWGGTGVDDPTTTTLINPDIQSIQANYAANITLIGGAVQPPYDAGMRLTPVPAGARFGNAPNPSGGGGLYGFVTGYLDHVNSFTVIGTDFEAPSGYPATANDGRHGPRRALPMFQAAASTSQVTWINAQFANLYLYDQTTSTVNLGYQPGGGGGGFFIHAPLDLDGTTYVNNSQVVKGFKGDRFNGGAPSFALDAGAGTLAARAEVYPGTGASEQTGGGLLAGTGNPGPGVGHNGDFYFRTDCLHGAGDCTWHKEGGLWRDLN